MTTVWRGLYGATRSQRIGLLLRAHRTMRGLTQADVARLCGWHRPVYARMERGVDHTPSLASLRTVTDALDIPLTAITIVLDAAEGRRNKLWFRRSADGDWAAS